MSQPTIGFATSAEYRDLTADDQVLARALERRGAKVVPVVWTETKPHEFACDLMVLRSVWDYHLHPDQFLHWVTAAGVRYPVVNPGDLVAWNIDKRYLLQVEQYGFPIPKTKLLEQGTAVDLATVLAQAGLSEVVIKPAVSASAYETFRVAAPQSAEFIAKLNSLLEDRDMLVQEFVPEIVSGGEWALILLRNSGGEFECTHAVNKRPRSGDFRVQEEHGGLHHLAAPPPAALEMAHAILKHFAAEAVYCRADMVMRDGGPVLMELELIEPLLHFTLAPEAAEKMAEALLAP